MLDQLSQSRPLILTTLLGLLLVPLLYLINSYSPPPEKAPSDYNSVILAFEFVSDDDELTEVLSPLSTQELRDVDSLNKVDFGFMVMYGIFLLSVVLKFKSLHKQDWLKYVALLVPLIVLADLMENLQLLELTEAFRNGVSSNLDTINMLAIYTWTKWILLAVVLGIIGYSLITANRYKWVGYALFLPLVFSASALALKTPLIEDTFGTSIFLCFFIVWLLSIFYKPVKA